MTPFCSSEAFGFVGESNIGQSAFPAVQADM